MSQLDLNVIFFNHVELVLRSLLGDTFGILPPAWVTLRFFPAMKEQFVRDTYDAEFSLWNYKGHKVVHLGEADWNYPGAVHPAKEIRVPWIYHRPRIARMLTTQCERLGILIKYGSTVVAYSESSQKATITLQSAEGETIAEADIVVATDGVGTKSHGHITGHQVRAESSGYANYRGCIPAELLKPQLRPQVFEKFFSSPRPEFRIYMTYAMAAVNEARPILLLTISQSVRWPWEYCADKGLFLLCTYL